jgi:hypothetical protein
MVKYLISLMLPAGDGGQTVMLRLGERAGQGLRVREYARSRPDFCLQLGGPLRVRDSRCGGGAVILMHFLCH